MKNSLAATLWGSSFRTVRELTTVLLALLLFITPIFQAYAQSTDAPSSTIGTSDATPAPTPSPTPTLTVPSFMPDGGAPLDSLESTPSDTSAPADDSVSAPSTDESDTALSPDSGLGSASLMSAGAASDYYRDRSRDVLNPTLPSSNTINGSLDYQYPISVPPGRTTLTTPDLKLVYNNQAGEDISPYGYGWSDNIPTIERINKTGPINLYSQNYFTSSLSGELATTSATTTRFSAKVENGDFLVYTFTNNVWKVKDKYGNQYTFGSSSTARLDDPNDSTHIDKWFLEEVRDANGNYIKYQYYKDNGQVYPSSIIYTGNGTTDGIFEVDFQREARSDIATSSIAAFQVISKYRINEIDTKVSGSINHKYILGYTRGDNGVRSLLSSVTETAFDESSASSTLPATLFKYATSTKVFTDNASLAPPTMLTYVRNSDSAEFDAATRVADINGDGLPDIVVALKGPSSTNNKAYINNGSGYTDDPTWYLPLQFVSVSGDDTRHDQGVQLADINGDHLTDVVQAVIGSGGFGATTYLNTGSGFSTSTTWALPVPLIAVDSTGEYDDGTRLADINGDGLIDVIQAITVVGTTTRYAYINNGHGFTEDPTWHMPVDFLTVDTSNIHYDLGVRLADINGDGLTDVLQSLVSSGSTTQHAFINTGSGFVDDPEWDIPLVFSHLSVASADNYDIGVRLVDVNGDGLLDVIQALSDSGTPTYHVYINNGHGFTEEGDWTLPVLVAATTPSGVNYDQGVVITDINGDGVDDFIQRLDLTGGAVAHAYLNTPIKADTLINVTVPKGGQVSLGYAGSAQYTSGGSLLSPNLPLNLQTIHTITKNNGLGTVGTTTYSYAGGSYYYPNTLDRKFAGFNTITAIDPSGNSTKTFYHQGNSTDSLNGEYSDDIYKLGKPYRAEVYNNASSLIKKTINKWDEYALASSSSFVKNIQTLEMDYEGGGTHKDNATQFTYDNTNGNLTQEYDLGEVTGVDAGILSDVGTDDFTTGISYASSTNSSVTGLPYLETTTDHSSAKVKETRHYYDTLSLGSIDKGNETKTEKLKSGSTYINTQKTYNSYGLVTQDQDPRGKQTNYTYDTNNLYVSTSTNPLSQVTSYLYNLAYGKVKQTKDPNGGIFQTTYDAFGRPLQINQPDTVATTTSVTKTAYVYTDTGLPTVVKATNYLNSATSTDTYSYVDGFGNTIQDRTQTENSNVYAAKDYQYNAQGQLVAQSLPYFSNGTTTTTATPIKNLYTYLAYDPLNRVISSKAVVGTTTYAYTPWKETITNTNGKTKDLLTDAYGNLSEVDEHNGASTYTTTYIYDGLKDLTKITDANSNVRNFTYDLLGRRLTAEDLHTATDTSFGTWNYTYDDANNLTQSVDPKSQTINYTFDDLNRPLTEDYTGQAGTELAYTYDSCVGGIGRLCQAASASATTTYQYDPLGNVNQETKRINSTNYTTNTVYDRQSNVATITNPDNSQIKYTYNNAGLVDSISRKESSDSTYTPVVNNFDYAPTNQVVYQSDANGIETYLTYDPNELYRLVSKTTLGPGANEGQNMMSMMMGMAGVDSLTFESAATNPNNTLTLNKNGTKTYKTPIEIIGKRTPRSDTFLVGYSKTQDPIYSTHIYSGDAYYIDPASRALVPINPSLKDNGSTWILNNAPYQAQLSKTLTNNFLIFANKGQELSFSVAEPVQPVSGLLVQQNQNAHEVLYTGALGQGIDIDVKAQDDRLEKNVVINKLSNLAASPSSTSTYDIPFKITANRNVDLIVDGKKLSEAKTITSSNMAQIIDSTGVSSYIWPPQASDSSVLANPNQRINIKVTYELKSDGIYVTKHIPVPWLKQATFPVTTDLVASYYTAAGDGTTETQPYPSSWSTQHADTTGRDVNYTSDGMVAYVAGYDTGAGFLGIARAFAPIDTSLIPSNATITAATLKLNVVAKFDDFNDSNGYATVLQGTESSVSTLSNSDIDNCGDAITNPTKGSSDVDVTGTTLNTYASFPLNATGLSWINRSGYTKFCIREGHDITNSAISTSGAGWKQEGFVFATAEATGTSTDPYLEVTYTVPNVAPSAPTSLLTDSSSNPTNLSDLTPYFSAIYNDSNTDDVSGYYQLQVSASSTSFTTSTLIWDSQKAALSTSTPVGTRSPNITYGGSPIAYNGATYYWRIKFWDSANVEGDWSTTTASFNLQNPPPTTNYSECLSAQTGSTSPTDIKCGSPMLSALKAAGTGIGEQYEIQVSTSTSFTNLLWDSGNPGKDIHDLAAGSRSPDIAYRGNPLNFATSTYYWRIKFWNNGLEGTWSSAAQFTTVNKHVLQNINYTYDTVGNITRITNNSDTSDAHYVDYTYDDLNRLLTASSTNIASGSNYHLAFAYDPIGNITNKSDKGSYTYANTNFANPHAVTSINSVTYKYDNNGNLASTTAGLLNTWNYRNEMTGSSNGTATTTELYDHMGQRVKYANGSNTTYYPSSSYDITGTTPTKHIYAGNQLVADLVGTGASTTVNYVNTDHLTGSNVISDSTGTVIENTDYYPYGEIRVDDKTTGYSSEQKFAGHLYDSDTGLSYQGARYEDPRVGRFVSEDPAFLAVGSDQLKQKTGIDLNKYLSDPQGLNSYSYARNNPMVNIDPDGNFWWYGFYDWTGYNGLKGVGMKALEVLGGHSRAMDQIGQYGSELDAQSASYNLDPAIARAITYEEQSHLLDLPGIPFESVKDYLLPNSQFGGYDGGVGLMQVSGQVASKFGFTKTEVARDPVKNINAGVGYINSISNTQQSTNPAIIGQSYNGAQAYGQRINAQVNNPNYNTNIITNTVQKVINGLSGLIKSIK